MRDAVSSLETGPNYSVGAVQRALAVLEELARTPDLSAAELARALSIPRGSAFRHLKVLEAAGYVSRDPASGRYGLGPELIHLGFLAQRQLHLPRVAAPTMVALRDRFDETTHLGVLSGGEVVHIEVVPSTHRVQMASRVGERAAPHASGLGKCLLAWDGAELPEELTALTDRTVTTRAGLEEELARTRERGWALDDEESGLGIRCVAAPIRDHGGDVVGAVSISGPAERLTLDRAVAAAPAVAEAAEEISTRLGWRAD